MITQLPVLILGGGLAGCTLAVTLIKKGIKVHVISSSLIPSATRVAAGVYNPVVLKRYTLAPHASAAVKKARTFYTDLETETGKHFHYAYPMVRVFESAGETNEFLRLTSATGFNEHLTEYNQTLPQALHAPFGCGTVQTAGRLDTLLYVEACRRYILAHESNWTEDEIHEEKIGFSVREVSYNNVPYHAIVFAYGHTMEHSKAWPMLRLKPVSGEVLDVELEGLPQEVTWHVGVYATPLGKNRYRVGATYMHDNTEGKTTFDGRNELLEKLTKHIKSKLTVVGHQAGVRPAAHDRNPYLGVHPVMRGLYIFNGLGSRGVLLAPLCAEWLAENMLKNAAIPYEWNVSRLVRK